MRLAHVAGYVILNIHVVSVVMLSSNVDIKVLAMLGACGHTETVL